MKVLYIYCNNFEYRTSQKAFDDLPDIDETAQLKNIQVAFIQIEEKDMYADYNLHKKTLNSIKWICRKNNTKKILLHSFAHLSESKATPEFTIQTLKSLFNDLLKNGYEAYQTPFGYFLDLKIDAPGYSLARVFQDL
ncbi:MAG: threonyl-tRNA synthetase editing domain-containing protein [Bacteroidales bacterium]|nr:threonyl-tRNA synthetase editing domain-containing protein [Bacteroidales bacterium]